MAWWLVTRPITVTVPPGNYVLAVSGGVDSMVLLDIFKKQQTPKVTVIVAHVDHGIREASHRDAQFVEAAAKSAGLPFISRRFELGANASEEIARKARYDFLQEVAKTHAAQIVTAHHADDVLETMAINVVRGTGWRGIAALRSEAIFRPLLEFWKAELVDYAREYNLTWREDETNNQPRYLRNRLRQKLAHLSLEQKNMLLALHASQVGLKSQIEQESHRLMAQAKVGEGEYARYMFIMTDGVVQEELLRAVFQAELGWSPPRPQLHRIAVAMKTFSAHATFVINPSSHLLFTRTTFIVRCAQA